MTLRNSVDDIAIEKQYHLYSPLIKEVKVWGHCLQDALVACNDNGALHTQNASCILWLGRRGRETPHLTYALDRGLQVLKYERARRAKLYYLRKRPARESYVNPKSYGLHF